MAEYIEREALMRRIKEIHCADCNSYHGVRCRACWVDDTFGYIESEPAADVAPVRHGRWIDLGDNYWERGRTSTRYKCSECGRRAGQKQAKLYHYCPNCGAKMDLEG